MSKLGVLSFGGNTHEGSSGTGAVTEIWECSLSISVSDAFDWLQSSCDTMAALVETWFTNSDSRIASTETLEFTKWNQFDLATGRQITDPTIQTLHTSAHSGVSAQNPVTTCYRISIDDSTRNPRHKGGWHPPRCAATIGNSGRFSESDVTGMMNTATTLINGINTFIEGIDVVGSKVGVWSRRDHAVHVSNRLRIGDVPDNIRKRKNKLLEHYQSGSL